MRFFIVAFVLTVISSFSVAQNKLAVSEIPDSLKKNADAVVRFKETTYQYKSDSKLLMSEHYAITILNEKGDDMSILRVFYDSDSKVKNIEGILYDANGLKTTELKNKLIQDYSAYASYTLFSDSRVKIANPIVKKYPYTVEYYYEIEYTKTILVSSWTPIDDFKQSLEKASLSIYPNGTNILSRLWNISPTYTDHTTKNGALLKWEVGAIKAIVDEPYSPSFSVLQPKIFLTPESVAFYGYQAMFTDWFNYGKLVRNLIDNRETLPSAAVSAAEKLCEGANSDIEKVKRIYEFVQGKVRYVNVNKGVGGFQPIDAQLVDKYSYGDCKALSNYTKALLKAVGINSYYTEIGSGDHVTIQFSDFASLDQTNHAIIVVPLKSDTVWLECTDNKIPFGYIGSSNCNRYALAVTEKGGELLNTPKYSSTDNRSSVSSKVELSETGDISINVDKTYSNEMFDGVEGFLYSSKQEQEKDVYSIFPLQGLKLKQFDFSNKSNYKNPIGVLSVNAIVPQYASNTGNRLLFKPNVFSKYNFNLPKSGRTNEISFDVGYTKSDSVLITLPKGYKLEFDFPVTKLQCLIGEYESKLIVRDDQTVIYLRKLVVNRGTYPVKDYNDIYNFFKQISLADNKSCVLVKS